MADRTTLAWRGQGPETGWRVRDRLGHLLAAAVFVLGALGLAGCNGASPDTGPTPEATGTGAATLESAPTLAPVAGVPSVDTVEDWSAYADAASVETAIERNLGLGENTMDLSLIPGDPISGVGATLAMAFEIRAAPPDDFVGFDRDLEVVADWSGAQSVGMWVAPQARMPGLQLAFQFRESSGEVWRHQGDIAQAPADAPLTLAFDADSFERTEWSPAGNGRMDLTSIDRYGLYVGHAGAGQAGSVAFGPIVLVR